MAFVNRRNKNIRSSDRKNGIEVETKSVTNHSEGAKNKSQRAKSFEEIKTYKDQAIAVLDILEQNGIDIYDPNRTPGMYLKRDKNNAIVNKLSSNGKLADSQSQNEKPVSSILNFLNNNK